MTLAELPSPQTSYGFTVSVNSVLTALGGDVGPALMAKMLQSIQFDFVEKKIWMKIMEDEEGTVSSALDVFHEARPGLKAEEVRLTLEQYTRGNRRLTVTRIFDNLRIEEHRMEGFSYASCDAVVHHLTFSYETFTRK